MVLLDHGDLDGTNGAWSRPVRRWKGSGLHAWADLLEEDPGAEASLRARVLEIQAALPAGMVSAVDHAVSAGE